MKIETAKRLIESLIYKPEWTFEVCDHSKRFEDAITVKITYPARETNRAEAEQGYPVINRPYATFPIMVGGPKRHRTLPGHGAHPHGN